MKLYTFDNGDGVKRVGVELSGFPGLIRDVRDFGLPYRDMTDLIRHITPSEKERIYDPRPRSRAHRCACPPSASARLFPIPSRTSSASA